MTAKNCLGSHGVMIRWHVGNSLPLLLRAKKLFSHVQQVLAQTLFADTPVSRDYVEILQRVLLATPAYCDCAGPHDVAGKQF